MKLDELKNLWNAQADQFNQWDELGLDEIVDFAQKQEREECAKVCEFLSEHEWPDNAEYGSYNEFIDAAAAIRGR